MASVIGPCTRLCWQDTPPPPGAEGNANTPPPQSAAVLGAFARTWCFVADIQHTLTALVRLPSPTT
jgi:hypothetical protein